VRIGWRLRRMQSAVPVNPGRRKLVAAEVDGVGRQQWQGHGLTAQNPRP
jgi:hypothetical protein